MFGLFKSKKSPLRQQLEGLFMVKRTWFEWTLEAERWTSTLVVEVDYSLDPASPDFDQKGLDQIAAVLREVAGAAPRVRVTERKYEV